MAGLVVNLECAFFFFDSVVIALILTGKFTFSTT
jgi:hypothetical protein